MAEDRPTQSLPRSALLFIGAVEAAREAGDSPFRAISPVFKIALEDQIGQPLQLDKAATHLRPIFGDTFSPQALEAFIPQLVEEGWITERRAAGGQAVYFVPVDSPAKTGNVTQPNILERLDEMYACFVEYMKEVQPLFSFNLNKNQFFWDIFVWATSIDGMDKNQIGILVNDFLEGRPQKLSMKVLDEIHEYSKVNRQTSILFAGFVKWLIKNDKKEIGIISSLTELGLVAEFLIEIRNPSSFRNQKCDVIFVFDAPVLLDALGLSGGERLRGISVCMEALKAAGAQFSTLRHCIDEMREIINTVLKTERRQRFGLTGDALRKQPELEQLARAVYNNPDSALKNKGIQILDVNAIPKTERDHFTEENVSRFRNSSSWHDFHKSIQRERDAQSIGYIIRKRNGFRASDLIDCRYILITRNTTFSQFAKQFCVRHLGYSNVDAPPAVESKTLAAFTWMRFGSSVSPNLPQIQLIAACERILQTNQSLMRKAGQKLDQLKNIEGASAVLLSHQAVLDLVLTTGGDSDVLDGQNAEQITAILSRSAAAEARREERERAKSAARAAEAKQKELTEEIKGLSIAKFQEESAKKKLMEQIDSVKSESEQRFLFIADQIQAEAIRFSNLVIDLVLFVSLFVSLFGQFFVWQGASWWSQGPFNFIIGALVITCSIFVVISGLHWLGLSFLNIRSRLVAQVTSIIIRRSLSKIVYKPDSERVRSILAARGLLTS